MNTTGCIKCGTKDGLKSYSFITVNIETNSRTSGRKTIETTKESLNGMTSCVVCNNCIRRKRIIDAIVSGITILIGVFMLVNLFGVYFLDNYYFNENAGKIELFALAVGILAAIIGLIVSFQKEDAFVAGSIKKAKDKKMNPAAASWVYVPMDISLYMNKQTNTPDIGTFMVKNGLKTALSGTLFALVLAGGANSNKATETVESAIPDVHVIPSETVRTDTPNVSENDLFNQSVQRLLALYREKPEGFLKAQAGEVRAVGEKLNAAGGMNLMLKVHQAFQAQNPNMARNLEIVWDGVGDWRG